MHLESLRLEYSFRRTFDFETINDLKCLLDQTHNVRSLTIDSCHMNMKKIYSVVPQHIKQLSVTPKTFNDMKMILQRLDHLSVVEFKSIHGKEPLPFAQIIEWLMQEQRNFVHEQEKDSLKILFEQNDCSNHSSLQSNKTSTVCILLWSDYNDCPVSLSCKNEVRFFVWTQK